MKYITDTLSLWLFFTLVGSCFMGVKHCEDIQERATFVQDKTTWEFETPSGTKIYSTQYKYMGSPTLESVGPNGCNPKYSPRWHYGDCLDWVTAKDDATGASIHPSCILLGQK
jgi:hypothetical protein